MHLETEFLLGVQHMIVPAIQSELSEIRLACDLGQLSASMKVHASSTTISVMAEVVAPRVCVLLLLNYVSEKFFFKNLLLLTNSDEQHASRFANHAVHNLVIRQLLKWLQMKRYSV